MENTKKEKIVSGQFGELEVADNHIFTFPEGLLGFEDEKRFIVVAEESIAPFKWLISMDNPNIGFPIVSPWFVKVDFDVEETINLEEKVPMVVVNTNKETKKSTANLKAPIFLCFKDRTGYQKVIENSPYSTEEEVTGI